MRPNLFSSIRHGSAIDLISSKWSICETPLSTQTSKHIGFGTARTSRQSPIQSICNRSNSIPIQQGKLPSLQALELKQIELQQTLSKLHLVDVQMDHPESIGLPEMATFGRKMDGWSRQTQAQRICKSVLFAQLHSLFNDFIWARVI